MDPIWYSLAFATSFQTCTASFQEPEFKWWRNLFPGQILRFNGTVHHEKLGTWNW